MTPVLPEAQTDLGREVPLDVAPAPSAAAAKVRCSRCVYDADTPGIVFDANGVCNYCRFMDEMDREYPTGPAGEKKLREIADRIRAAGRGKPFDVVVGVSGGCDSSLLVYKAKELGLRPLAAHFDNTWDSQIAVENIHRVLKALDVELFTYVVDNEEYNDIYRSFMLAGVPDLEAPTDIGLATTMYMAAARYGIRYMFQGHNFRTEGSSPLGWLYMDGKYVESVVRQFGHYDRHRFKTYPNLWLSRFIKYLVVNRIRQIRPLYWYAYDKEEAKQFLAREFGWQWYGGHHLENRFTAFYHSYYLPRRFGIDQRPNGHAALVRSGQITRAAALEDLAKPPHFDPDVVKLVKKRLGFSDSEFEELMRTPMLRTCRDFKTYKRTFERLRPFFWLLYKMELVPKSFYAKYTARSNR